MFLDYGHVDLTENELAVEQAQPTAKAIVLEGEYRHEMASWNEE